MEDIAARLKKVRGTKSAKDFAAIIGCSSQTIYRYEWGERMPDNDFLQVVAEKTGYSLEWLKGTEKDVDVVKRNRKKIPPDSPRSCAQCMELKLRLEKTEMKLDVLEEERRVVSAENRRLHNALEEMLFKNGELQAQVVKLEERLKAEGGGGTAEVSKTIASKTA